MVQKSHNPFPPAWDGAIYKKKTDRKIHLRGGIFFGSMEPSHFHIQMQPKWSWLRPDRDLGDWYKNGRMAKGVQKSAGLEMQVWRSRYQVLMTLVLKILSTEHVRMVTF